MSADSLPRFYLRTISPLLWLYSLPALIFVIPWISWIGDGSSSRLDITLLTSPGNLFGLIAGLTFLWSSQTNMGWALPNNMPHAEFLLTRPVVRRRMCVVCLSIFYVIVLAPSVLAVAATAFKPDMRLSLYKSDTQSTEAADRQAAYEKGFPHTYVEPGKNRSTLVAPYGQLYAKVWQFASVTAAALLLQWLLFRRKQERKFAKYIPILIMWLFLLPTLAFVFRRDLVMPVFESVFFFFVQNFWLCLIALLVAFVSMQVWTLRRARDLEVL